VIIKLKCVDFMDPHVLTTRVGGTSGVLG